MLLVKYLIDAGVGKEITFRGIGKCLRNYDEGVGVFVRVTFTAFILAGWLPGWCLFDVVV